MNNVNNEHNRNNNDEQTVLRQAIIALEDIVPLKQGAKPVKEAHDPGYDFIIKGDLYGQKLLWCAKVKKHLTKAGELQALIQKDQTPHPLLLVTTYVNNEAAKRLHKAGIQFIDTGGNAFLNQPPLYIFVKGNKPEEEDITPPAGRLFKGVGLKIAYLLLCKPELAEKPYRDLARFTDVALGTVNITMAELIQKGYILDMGKKGKRLLNRKALFERWVTAYADYLKPKLLLGRFRGEGDWWNNVRLDPNVAQWGGEVAAAKLTKYLKPGTVTLYADKNRLTDLIVTNKLKKDPNGTVEVLERFWPQDIFGEGETVNPILIYANLAALGEQRTMETARLIYEQHLDKYLGQD
jgi:hypothetical protein